MLAAEWRPSKWQDYWERPEYWEESGRLEETCCHSNSSERPSANVDAKNSRKKKKFRYINKWYMRKPEAVLENETHKLPGDFDRQMDHSIPVGRRGVVLTTMKKNLSCWFCCASWQKSKMKVSVKLYRVER